MSTGINIRGRVESGRGEAAYFTSLDWVVNELQLQAGFSPFPGTLNVRINLEDTSYLDQILDRCDFEVVPSDPRFCSARFKKARLNGITAVVVIPEEAVRIHERVVLEVIAPCNLKETLGLSDGDEVIINMEESTNS